MKVPTLTEKLAIPDKVHIEATNQSVKVKGPKGEIERTFTFRGVELSVADGFVSITAKDATRIEKMQVGTARAHILNMFNGVTKGHVYKLKICSGHFPMNVTLSGDKFSVKNFLGEKVPRVLKIKPGAKVTLDGNNITVESIDIEKAGQIAAGIEQLTRVTDKDIRIFQDGIYIVKKSKRL
ncbi:MAG: 50S ribosomal protein L6 [Candidatus Woesearchaeota archaeon]